MATPPCQQHYEPAAIIILDLSTRVINMAQKIIGHPLKDLYSIGCLKRAGLHTPRTPDV